MTKFQSDWAHVNCVKETPLGRGFRLAIVTCSCVLAIAVVLPNRAQYSRALPYLVTGYTIWVAVTTALLMVSIPVTVRLARNAFDTLTGAAEDLDEYLRSSPVIATRMLPTDHRYFFVLSCAKAVLFWTGGEPGLALLLVFGSFWVTAQEYTARAETQERARETVTQENFDRVVALSERLHGEA